MHKDELYDASFHHGDGWKLVRMPLPADDGDEYSDEELDISIYTYGLTACALR